MEKFFWAFLIGGIICAIGQILMDVFRMTPAHTMTTLVVTGTVLGGLGWYEPLIKLAGAGATTPISSFGNALFKGAMAESELRPDRCSDRYLRGNKCRYICSYSIRLYRLACV